MSSNTPKYKPTLRPLPKPIRFITRGFVYRQFTWTERFQVLLGFRLLVEIQYCSEHNPGQTQPITKFHMTDKVTQASAMLELRAQNEKEQAAKGVMANTIPDSDKEAK